MRCLRQVLQQITSFYRQNPQLKHSPNSIRLC